MKLPQLLCLAGKAGVGKDTVADYLVREHGYVKYRFADPLKKLLNERFGWDASDWDDRSWKEGAVLKCLYSGRVYSPRHLAQWLGTEVGRTIGGANVWVDAMWRDYTKHHNGKHMVVCDARFDNEAASFWARGGDVLHIERPGAEKVLAHASEAGISKEYWSYSVVNDCPMEEFLKRVIDTIKEIP